MRGEDSPPGIPHSRSSGFPARDPHPQCHVSGVFFEPQRTQRPQRKDNCHEAAAFVCAVRVVAGFQGDLPPHPRPLSPVPGARGGFCVFQLQWKSRIAPLAPGRGEGPGVRGEGPPACILHSRSSGFPARDPPCNVTRQGCFLNHREHRDHRGKTTALRQPVCVCGTAVGGVPGRLAPSPPTPLPRSGGEGRILCFSAAVEIAHSTPRPSKGRGED